MNSLFIGGVALVVIAVLMTFDKLWSSFILLVLAGMIFYRLGERLWVLVSFILATLVFLKLTSSIIWPVALALVIAFIFTPVVSYLERFRIPRGVSAFVIIVGMFLGITTLGGVLTYQAYVQVKEVLAYVYISPDDLKGLLQSWGVDPRITEVILTRYTDLLRSLTPSEFSVQLLKQSAEVVFSTVLGLVIGFYALKDTHLLARELTNLLPPRLSPLLEDMYVIMSKYFRGQILVATIVGVFVGGALQVLGVRFGFLIGLLAGVFNLIPNVGFALTVVFGLIIILATGKNFLWDLIAFAGVLAADHLLETFVLTPRILGKSVGIHPVMVMLALVIGATLFGPMGLILAVPMAAFLRSLWLNTLRGRI